MTSCKVYVDKDSSHTTVEQLNEFQQLDSTSLKLVVIDAEENTVKIINPETHLIEASVYNGSFGLQIFGIFIAMLLGFLISATIFANI